MYSRFNFFAYMTVLLLLFFFTATTTTNVDAAAAAMTDKATGITFPDEKNGLSIFGVGVRMKGPIKVYSVGMYGSTSHKERLFKVPKDNKLAFTELRDGARDGNTTFLLKMNFKVSADKMATSITDALSPRFSGSRDGMDKLKGLISGGVSKKGAAIKGTTLQFECSKQGVAVSVDGAKQGNVSASGIGGAFCDIYLDDKSVSPTLRKNCILNCCK